MSNTTNYNLELLPKGAQNWHIQTNDNFSKIDTELKNINDDLDITGFIEDAGEETVIIDYNVATDLQNQIAQNVDKIGLLSTLPTTDKTSIVNSIKEVNTQLAEQTTQISGLETNKAEKSEVNSLASGKVDINGSGQVTYANLAQDVRTVLTGGSVAVVGIDSVLENNVTDGALTPVKTSFLQDVKGNLIDYNTIIQGYYINNASGALVSNVGFACTDYIRVYPNTDYYSSSDRPMAWYDKNKNYISGSGGGWISPVTSPSTAYYIRLSINIADISKVYFGKKSSWTLSTGKQEEIYPNDKFKQMINRTIRHKKVDIDNIFGITTNFKNLINPYEIQLDSAVDNNTGFIYSMSGYNATAFIAVIAGTQYCATNQYQIAFYDADKKFVSGIVGGGWTNPLTIPNGVSYIRLTISPLGGVFSKGSSLMSSAGYGDGTITIDPYLKNALLNALGGNSNLSLLAGKKINALGDSITGTDYTTPTWWQQIASEKGCAFNNYGVSGTSLAHTSRDATYGACMVERFTSMDTNVDAVIVMGGTNDNYLTPRGDWASTDTSTLFGALNVLIPGLLSKFQGKPILFCTPIQRSDSYNASDYRPDPKSFLLNTATNTETLPVQIIAEAIKAKCSQYGIPCLDLFNSSGINGVISGLYHRDIWHPTALGQSILKREIGGKLEELFS